MTAPALQRIISGGQSRRADPVQAHVLRQFTTPLILARDRVTGLAQVSMSASIQRGCFNLFQTAVSGGKL